MYSELYSELKGKTNGKVVRIYSEGMDLVVLEIIDGKEIEHRRFNEMSDDYAYTNAKEFAMELVK